MDVNIDTTDVQVRYCPRCDKVLKNEYSYVSMYCLDNNHEIQHMNLAEFLNYKLCDKNEH